MELTPSEIEDILSIRLSAWYRHHANAQLADAAVESLKEILKGYPERPPIDLDATSSSIEEIRLEESSERANRNQSSEETKLDNELLRKDASKVVAQIWDLIWARLTAPAENSASGDKVVNINCLKAITALLPIVGWGCISCRMEEVDVILKECCGNSSVDTFEAIVEVFGAITTLVVNTSQNVFLPHYIILLDGAELLFNQVLSIGQFNSGTGNIVSTPNPVKLASRFCETILSDSTNVASAAQPADAIDTSTRTKMRQKCFDAFLTHIETLLCEIKDIGAGDIIDVSNHADIHARLESSLVILHHFTKYIPLPDVPSCLIELLKLSLTCRQSFVCRLASAVLKQLVAEIAGPYEIINQWAEFIALMDALHETQPHIIKPFLPKLPALVESVIVSKSRKIDIQLTSRPNLNKTLCIPLNVSEPLLLSPDWLCTTFQVGFNHLSSDVVNSVVLTFLDIPPAKWQAMSGTAEMDAGRMACLWDSGFYNTLLGEHYLLGAHDDVDKTISMFQTIKTYMLALNTITGNMVQNLICGTSRPSSGLGCLFEAWLLVEIPFDNETKATTSEAMKYLENIRTLLRNTNGLSHVLTKHAVQECLLNVVIKLCVRKSAHNKELILDLLRTLNEFPMSFVRHYLDNVLDIFFPMSLELQIDTFHIFTDHTL